MNVSDNIRNGVSTLSVLIGTCLAMHTAVGQTQQPKEQAVSCSMELRVDDTLRFYPPTVEVPLTCEQFTILFSHRGRLPKVASPRNWVLTSQATADAVARDAELAGARNHWVKPHDERVLAASSVIGSGETVRIELEPANLAQGSHYTYLSTIPGFSPVLRGKLTVVP